MQLSLSPQPSEWPLLTQRSALDITALFDVVCPIFEAVRNEGDEALRRYAAQFDHVQLDSLSLSQATIDAAAQALSPELRAAIDQARANIQRFHEAQRFAPIRVETAAGIVCEQRAVPIERVGLYIPGGSAPLFSTVLMLAVPAQIAGCREVVLCTPPQREGGVHPAILYAAQLCGVRKIFTLGGAQAVAAMAIGTASVPRVDKIFGPGNAYVMAAKQWASLHGVAIDMPAGPSEVEVIADESCNPAFVAADLLSQAEHGADSQAILLTPSRALAETILAQLEAQLEQLPRKETAAAALRNSRAIVLESKKALVDFTNAYAPEHLIIATTDAAELADRITTAGSIFVGNWSCESAGDYASGTNHTLPTSGYARAYSGLSLDSFQRKTTLQTLSPEGVRSIGQTVVAMARAEQLEAHAQAMALRLEALQTTVSPTDESPRSAACACHTPLSQPHTKAGSTPSEAAQSTSEINCATSELRKSTSEVSCANSEEASCAAERAIAPLVRPSIARLAPYSCARDEFKGGNAQTIFLDANESPYGVEQLNRYPDPLQWAVKAKIAALKNLRSEQIILGNGSDEIIDLVFRVFCEPRLDNVVVLDPSYGMYEVCAGVNDVECRKVQLGADFAFTATDVLAACDERTKAVFLCSPNNPTGNLLDEQEIATLLNCFEGIVVIDEAYIDFAPEASWCGHLDRYPRLLVLSTFSKAWASAAIRLGMGFASEAMVRLMNKVKYPYNINELTQRRALELLDAPEKVQTEVQQILHERQRLSLGLSALPFVKKVYPSDANFLLVRVADADETYRQLSQANIIVRNRNRVTLCQGCLRITVGSPAENEALLQTLRTL